MASTSFVSNWRTWIFFGQIFGLFPYYLSGQKVVRSKYYIFHAFRCFVLFIGNEIFFSKYKYNFSFFGWIYEFLDLMFDTAWLICWFRNNAILVQIFECFDKLDEKFKSKVGVEIDQRSMFYTPSVIILLALYALNFVTVGILVHVNGFSIVICIIYSIVRSLERCSFVLFTASYLYLMHCLQFRYLKLKQACNEVIYTSIRDKTFSSHSSNRLMEIKLLQDSLSNIAELLNHGFGSRCVVLHGQLFHLILMYFYLMFTEIKLAVTVLPLYVIPPLLIAVSAQNLCSSTTINSCFFELASDQISERVIQQVYTFVQQLRCSPIKIDAAGFFNLNQSFFFSMTFSIASYLVAVFQLAPLMNRISMETAMSIL